MYFNAFLQATKDSKRDVTLIKNFIYIPMLTCNSSIDQVILHTASHDSDQFTQATSNGQKGVVALQ